MTKAKKSRRSNISYVVNINIPNGLKYFNLQSFEVRIFSASFTLTKIVHQIYLTVL